MLKVAVRLFLECFVVKCFVNNWIYQNNQSTWTIDGFLGQDFELPNGFIS